METFAAFLRRELYERDLTQSEFARRVGVSPSAISTYVNGKYTPYDRTKDRIMRALGYEPETPKIETIGDAIYTLLRAHGVSQAQLSRRTDLSEWSISMYITGKRIPTVGNLVKIATALDCELKIAFEDKEGGDDE